MPAWGPLCPTTRRRLLLSVLVFALALAARLGVYYEARDWPTFTQPQIDEYTAYHIGLALLDGRMPDEVYLKGPFYMWFVAGVVWLFGRDPMHVRLVQAVVSSLTPVLIFLTAERIFGRRIGLLSGIAVALFWTIVYYSLSIVDAAVSTLLYTLMLYVAVRVSNERWWKWPVCGVVMGLGALSRPSVLAFAPLLAIMVFIVMWRDAAGEPRPKLRDLWRRPGLGRGLVGTIALTAGCLAVVLPVTVRNYVVGGEWVLIGAYGGQNLWIANSPRSDGKNVPIYVGEGVPKVSPVDPNDVWTEISLGNRIARYYAEQDLGRRLKFGEIDAWFAKKGFEYIAENPGAFLHKSFQRFCFFFNAYEYPNERDIYWFLRSSKLLTVLSYVHFGVICPLAVVGLGFAAARRDWSAEQAYLVGLLFALWAPGLMFVVNARFRVVITALLIPLAAYGFVCLLGLVRREVRWRTRVIAVAGLAGMAVFSNTNLYGYREPYYTDMRMGFAVACFHDKRTDLIPDAMARFAEALDKDVASGSLSQTAIMEHAHPIGFLFDYYFSQGDDEKALRYGLLMREHEPPKPDRLVRLYDLLTRVGRHEEAGRLLERLASGELQVPLVELGPRLFFYGTRHKHRPSLVRAEPILERLVEIAPTNVPFHQMLKETRQLLAESRSTSTQASRPAGH